MAKVYVTFNPRSEIGRHTAFRLQTLANLYGHIIYIPARGYNPQKLNTTTKERIDESDVVVAMGMGRMSKILKQELAYALQQGKPIIFLTERHKKLPSSLTDERIQVIAVEPGNTEEAVQRVTQFIHQKFTSKNKSHKIEKGLIAAFIIAAIILLIFWLTSGDD